MTHECSYCHRDFDSDRGLNIHISKKHSDKSKVEVECHWCGGEFLEGRNDVPKRPFCEGKCRSAWNSWYLSGDKHPNYKGGKSTRGKEWEMRALSVRSRDSECLNCGRQKTKGGRHLHVHHLIHEDEFEDSQEAHQFTNLVALCFTCHKNLEGESVADQLEQLGIESTEDLSLSEEQRKGFERTLERSDPQKRAPARRPDFEEVEAEAASSDPREN